MPLDPIEQLGRNDAELIRDLRAVYGDTFDRVVYGVFSIEDFAQDNDVFEVVASGTLKVADLDRELLLFEADLSRRAQAGDSRQAINAAFRSLGKAGAALLQDPSIP